MSLLLNKISKPISTEIQFEWRLLVVELSTKSHPYLVIDNYKFLEMIVVFMHERCSISWRHYTKRPTKWMYVTCFNDCLLIYFCFRHLLSRRLVALPVNCISYFRIRLRQIVGLSKNEFGFLLEYSMQS